MSRRHSDLIEVQTCAAPTGPVPEQFLWRGRRYLVREVLSRWTQSGSWWTGTAMRSFATAGEPATTRLDDRPQQWWRVAADSGRLAALSAGPGIYDLCFEESAGHWWLRRVMD